MYVSIVYGRGTLCFYATIVSLGLIRLDPTAEDLSVTWPLCAKEESQGEHM